MDIAVVGAGISGLVAALELQDHHRVTLFESASYLGGHTHTIELPTAGGMVAVDTGFIVFNQHTYPHFNRLLERLGVASRPTQMSFSVRSDPSGLEYIGSGLGGLFLQKRRLFSPRHHRMIRDILRFNREASRLAGHAEGATLAGLEDVGVREWVETSGYSRGFLEDYLRPLGASLWSCPVGTFDTFPIRFVIEFLFNHSMLQVSGRPIWRVIEGGSHGYVRNLAARLIGPVHKSTPVLSLRRLWNDQAVEVITPCSVNRFDHVILACHANQALRMLHDADPEEKAVLEAFPYETNQVLLHTDTSVLPRDRRAWAAWNARLHNESERFSITYNMNILQGLSGPETYCVTLNDATGIDPAKILGCYEYSHPLYCRGRVRAQRRHGEFIARRGLSFCGAYWGFGFHEDGVRSALALVRALKGAGATGQTSGV